MEATAARDLYLRELDRIERIVRYVCRHDERADVEDFSSVVKLRLIEEDFSIIRKFRGGSRFSTYLITVIQRLYVDHRVRERGRWRSSAAARRLGPLGIRLEELTRRDCLTLDEAFLVLTMNEARPVTRDELTRLHAQIPTRVRGRRALRSPRPDDATTDGTEVLDGLVRRDRDRAIARAVRVLDGAMRELDADERLLLARAFVQGRSMTEVSRDMQVSRHSLHRRVSRTLERLRELVEAGGLCAVKARELFALGPLEFEVPAIARHAVVEDGDELELAAPREALATR